MPPPRVLILGHSFIRRLKTFIENYPTKLDLAFQISTLAAISWRGVGGVYSGTSDQYDTRVMRSNCLDIVIVPLGTNALLHDSYGVKCVCMYQTIRCRSAKKFNEKVNTLTKYLRVVLEPIPYSFYWGHRGFWNAKANFFASDGVHLNSRGQLKLYRSLRGEVLTSLRFLAKSLPSKASLALG